MRTLITSPAIPRPVLVGAWLFLCLTLAGGLVADEEPTNPRELGEQTAREAQRDAREIREEAADMIGVDPEDLEPDQDDIERAERVVEDGQEPADEADWVMESLGEDPEAYRGHTDPDAAGQGEAMPGPAEGLGTDEGRELRVYVSESLPESELAEISEHLQALDKPAYMVFRGIREDESINDLLGRIAAWNQPEDDTQEPTPAQIDPTLYHEDGIVNVPVMVLIEDGKEIARASGLNDPQWLIEQVDEHDQSGDLGQIGPVREIVEVDMIELMQQRIAEVDWQEKRNEAYERFWQTVEYTELPAAERSKTRRVDPSIRVEEDVVTPGGQVLAHAGETINPLDQRPFTRRLVIFDATVEEERQWVRNRPDDPDRMDILIATRMPRDGWEAAEDLQESFEEPVYLLQPTLRDRFQLKRRPALVTAKDRHFVIQEIGHDDLD